MYACSFFDLYSVSTSNLHSTVIPQSELSFPEKNASSLVHVTRQDRKKCNSCPTLDRVTIVQLFWRNIGTISWTLILPVTFCLFKARYIPPNRRITCMKRLPAADSVLLAKYIPCCQLLSVASACDTPSYYADDSWALRVMLYRNSAAACKNSLDVV